MKKFCVDIECRACGGTGLFSGMAEKEGAAIVCYVCHGTGCEKYSISYNLFGGRKVKEGIKWVYQTNPGICVGNGGGYKYNDFGGMSYKKWNDGKKFTDAMAMEKFACPAWWYQSVDYKRKPNWDECPGCGFFSDCKYFITKENCWKRFKKEKL